MYRIVLATALCPMLAFSAHAQTRDAAASGSQPPLAGAYAPAALDLPIIQEAKQFVQSRLLTMTLGQVQAAYVQVVAGMNVKLICSAQEEGREASWKFVAFRSLDEQWHLSLAERL